MDYCDVFISCLNSHSNGTHSLQRIHLEASDVMLNFSNSFLIRKQTNLYLGWPEDKTSFSKILWVNYSSKMDLVISRMAHFISSYSLRSLLMSAPLVDIVICAF